MRRLWIFVLLVLLVGCSPALGLLQVRTPTFTPAVPTITPTLRTPTQVVTEPYTGQCAYTWATQDLPEVSAKLAKAYKDAGFADIEAHASAYGENCMDPNSSKAISFSAMETDFYLTVPVQSTRDTQVSGDWVAKLLPVLDAFPPGQVPGPNPGQVSIRFKDSAGEDNLWFPLKTGQDLVKQGLKGSALYDALKNKGS